MSLLPSHSHSSQMYLWVVCFGLSVMFGNEWCKNTGSGFSVTRGGGNYGSQNNNNGVCRLKSQLSFSGQDSLSQISEMSESVVEGVNSSNANANIAITHSFGIDSWDSANSNSIVFTAPHPKRPHHSDSDFFNCLESQVPFFLRLYIPTMV